MVVVGGDNRVVSTLFACYLVTNASAFHSELLLAKEAFL